MKKNIFLLLGGNKLNLGILKKFKKLGYQVFVVDWNEHPQLTGDRHYRIDVKDSAAIIQALEQDKVLDQVAFAYSSIDLAVPSVAKLNRAFGMQTISDDALKNAVSKANMTQTWAQAGLLNRISKKYTAWADDIMEFNKACKLIIKPDNSASSRGITIVSKNASLDILKEAFGKAFAESSDNTVVVEEFVEGTEFTVEMLGDGFGNVCVYGISKKTHTQNTNHNKIAVKLHYNCICDDLQQKIAAYAIRCYKALGFSSSLGHLEILLTEDGVLSPVEIGARSSGFIASDLADIVSGRDFLVDTMHVLNGEKVPNGLRPQTALSSMYFFYDFPAHSKVVKEMCLLDLLSPEITSRYFDRTSLVVGRHFNKIDNDNARIGFEILQGPKSIMTPAYIAQKEQEMIHLMLQEG